MCAVGTHAVHLTNCKPKVYKIVPFGLRLAFAPNKNYADGSFLVQRSEILRTPVLYADDVFYTTQPHTDPTNLTRPCLGVWVEIRVIA